MSKLYYDTARALFIEESGLSEKIIGLGMFTFGILIIAGFISKRNKKIDDQ
jgi:hypothetical protein